MVVDCKVGGSYQVDTRHEISDEFQLYQAYTLEFRFVNGTVKVQVVINEPVREKTNNLEFRQFRHKHRKWLEMAGNFGFRK